jgi:hypothetical protein
MIVFRVLYSRFAGLNRFLESLMVPDGSVELIRRGMQYVVHNQLRDARRQSLFC